MIRSLLALVLLIGVRLPAAAQTTVILVRHAEKAATPANDPPLTAEGEARARALVGVVRDAGVQAIMTTQFLRTRETARPAAEALHITPEVVNAGGPDHAAEVARRIRTEHAGQVVLVVEHSNTIPAIIKALGAPEPAPICDGEYDGLYTVMISKSGSVVEMKSRYGAPSAVGAGCGAMKP